MSAETTLDQDVAALRPLERTLWELSERVSARLKARAGHRRHHRDAEAQERGLQDPHAGLRAQPPDQLANRIFAVGRDLLRHEATSTKFRLLGIGVSQLGDAAGDDLADLIGRRSAEAELAVNRLRQKFGRGAVVKGLSLEDDS